MFRKILIIMILAVTAFSAEQLNKKPSKLKNVAVSEGFSLGGIEGTVSFDAEGGVFYFHPYQEIADGVGFVVQGGGVEILKSSSLDAITKVYDPNMPLDIKVWGQFTVFDKTNYVYISHMLAQTNAVQSLDTEDIDQKPSDNEQVIPSELLSRLRKGQKSANTDLQKVFENQRQDSIYADKTGFIQVSDSGDYVFVADSYGRNIENNDYILLKCSVLEDVITKINNSLAPVRFRVAGIETEYNDAKYILLHRAVRAYGHGNLSKF